MKTIEEYFRDLSREELNEAFKEYEEWRKTGVLKDGILRTTHEDFIADQNVRGTIHMICEPFLYVFAKTLLGGQE